MPTQPSPHPPSGRTPASASGLAAGPAPSPTHVPVLAEGVARLLMPPPGGVLVDCTAGLGGHARLLAPALLGSQPRPSGSRPPVVVLNDVDPANLARARDRVVDGLTAVGAAGGAVDVRVRRGNFATLPPWLESEGLLADVVLADLGFASNQVDDPARGLSFAREGPLDMRLDPRLPVSASDLVNDSSEAELREVISRYGEEPAAARIARMIVQNRRTGPIKSTTVLAAVVRSAFPRGAEQASRIDLATRTFQALRIAVNDEIGTLEALLRHVERDAERLAGCSTRPVVSAGRGWMRPGARIGVISFHSLEDRAVKGTFRRLTKEFGATDLSGGIFEAGESEIRDNPRSRSAKLRVVRLVERNSADCG